MSAPGLPIYDDVGATLKRWQRTLTTYLSNLDKRILALEEWEFEAWSPTLTSSSGTLTVTRRHISHYRRLGELCIFFYSADFDLASANADRLQLNPPFASATGEANPDGDGTATGGGDIPIYGRGINPSIDYTVKAGFEDPDLIFVRRGDGTAWQVANNNEIYLAGVYKVAPEATLL